MSWPVWKYLFRKNPAVGYYLIFAALYLPISLFASPAPFAVTWSHVITWIAYVGVLYLFASIFYKGAQIQRVLDERIRNGGGGKSASTGKVELVSREEIEDAIESIKRDQTSS